MEADGETEDDSNSNSIDPCPWAKLFNTLSENNLVGWVSTASESEKVRKSFEQSKSLRFVGERKGNFGKIAIDITPFDAAPPAPRVIDAESGSAPVFIITAGSSAAAAALCVSSAQLGVQPQPSAQSPASFRRLRVQENELEKALNSSDETLSKKNEGIEKGNAPTHGVIQGPAALGLKSYLVRFSDHKEGIIPYDGVPFIILASYTLCCMYGRDKNKPAKLRHDELVQSELKGESPATKQRRKRIESMKRGCPATMRMKEVIRFPQFQALLKKKTVQSEKSQALRGFLQDGSMVEAERRVYISLPPDEAHNDIHKIGVAPEIFKPKRRRKYVKKGNLENVTLQTIEEADQRIREHIHLTAITTSTMLDRLTDGCKLFFKCELFQKTGSFKIRGALNAVTKLMEDSPDTSDLKVITHSSGNFGQALAYAAQLKGLESFVVMPNTDPLTRLNMLLSYGATVLKFDPTGQTAEDVAALAEQEMGAKLIPPSQTYDVISGYGTIGLEFLQQIPELDAVIVPVGGGGLIAGIATAIKKKNPEVKVYAAEPENKADCFTSFQEKELLPSSPGPVDTVAGSLRECIGEITWPFIGRYVDGVITVSEEEIKSATRMIWQYLKLFAEPSAGVALAAVLSRKFSQLPHEMKNVAVIVCGGNVDIDSILVKDWL